MTTTLAFGITADPSRAKAGFAETGRDLDALKMRTADLRSALKGSADTFGSMGTAAKTAGSEASTASQRIADTVKQLERDLNEARQNWKQFGTQGKAEAAIAQNALAQMQRQVGQTRGAVQQLTLAEQHMGREGVQQGGLVTRALQAISRQAALTRASLREVRIGGGTAVTGAVGAFGGGLAGGALSGGLAGIAATAGATLSLGNIVQQADDMQRLRLIVQGSTKDFAERDRVLRDLITISNENNASIATSVKLYDDLEQAQILTGASTDQMLRVTDLLERAVRTSGMTYEEGASQLQTFIQSLNDGAVTSREVMSLFKQFPDLGRAIADGLGIPADQAAQKMKALAEAGQLTTDRILSALLKSGDVIDQSFGKLAPLASDFTTQISNSFKILSDNVIQSSGFMAVLGDITAEVKKLLESPATAGFLVDVLGQAKALIVEVKELIAWVQGLDKAVKDFDPTGMFDPFGGNNFAAQGGQATNEWLRKFFDSLQSGANSSGKNDSGVMPKVIEGGGLVVDGVKPSSYTYEPKPMGFSFNGYATPESIDAALKQESIDKVSGGFDKSLRERLQDVTSGLNGVRGTAGAGLDRLFGAANDNNGLLSDMVGEQRAYRRDFLTHFTTFRQDMQAILAENEQIFGGQSKGRYSVSLFPLEQGYGEAMAEMQQQQPLTSPAAPDPAPKPLPDYSNQPVPLVRTYSDELQAQARRASGMNNQAQPVAGSIIYGGVNISFPGIRSAREIVENEALIAQSMARAINSANSKLRRRGG